MGRGDLRIIVYFVNATVYLYTINTIVVNHCQCFITIVVTNQSPVAHRPTRRSMIGDGGLLPDARLGPTIIGSDWSQHAHSVHVVYPYR